MNPRASRFLSVLLGPELILGCVSAASVVVFAYYILLVLGVAYP